MFMRSMDGDFDALVFEISRLHGYWDIIKMSPGNYCLRKTAESTFRFLQMGLIRLD